MQVVLRLELDFVKQFMNGLYFFGAQGLKCIDNPAFVSLGHVMEIRSALIGELNSPCSAIPRLINSLNPALFDQLVSDRGDVAPTHHHATRQFTHLHAMGFSIELCHQIKSGKRRLKLRSET